MRASANYAIESPAGELVVTYQYKDINTNQTKYSMSTSPHPHWCYSVITPVLIPDGVDAIKSVESMENAGCVTAMYETVLRVHLN